MNSGGLRTTPVKTLDLLSSNHAIRKMTRTSKISLLVVAIVAAIAFWFFRDLDSSPQTQNLPGASPSEVNMTQRVARMAVESAANTRTTTGEANSTKSPTGTARGDLYQRFKNATNFGVFYRELEELGKSTPEARYYQGTILQICTAFYGPVVQRLEEKISSAAPNVTRRSTVELLKNRCDGVPVEASTVSGADLLKEAAAKGDAKAQAALYKYIGIGVGEKSLLDTQTVRDLALRRDPEVVNNLDGYFRVRNNLLVWNIPGIEGPVSGNEMAFAFNFAACEMGYDCSSSSLDVQLACALRGWCNFNDRIEQFRSNYLSPASFERTQVIKKVLMNGFATGVWPPGFWSGSNGTRTGH